MTTPLGDPGLWESQSEFIRWHADLPAKQIILRGKLFGFNIKADTIYKTKLRLKGKLKRQRNLATPAWYWERELWRAYIRACCAAGPIMAFGGEDFANLSIERIQQEWRKIISAIET